MNGNMIGNIMDDTIIRNIINICFKSRLQLIILKISSPEDPWSNPKARDPTRHNLKARDPNCRWSHPKTRDPGPGVDHPI